MTATRIVLGVLGVATAAFGVTRFAAEDGATLLRVAAWALAAVLVHDLIFAPLCVALGFGGRRLLPRRWWGPVAVAGLCSVVLLLVSIPVLGRGGAVPDNPTVLDRDYPAGLAVSLVLVWVVAAMVIAARELRRRSPIGENEVVERQRADDVERQPPAG